MYQWSDSKTTITRSHWITERERERAAKKKKRNHVDDLEVSAEHSIPEYMNPEGGNYFAIR